MKETIIPVTGFAQNCTLIWCEETVQGAVIDPGGDIEKILAAVEQHEVMVAKILITHGHIDHAGGAAALAEKLGCPIEGPHKEDAFLVTDLVQQGAQFGLVDVQNFEPTRWFDQGDTVSFGNITLDVIHCPGHTPGHVVFFHKDENIAIVGDVLFQGSIGRTDFPGGDHPTLIRSIKERLWPLGNDVTFIPGHGPHSTFGIERQTNPFVGDQVV